MLASRNNPLRPRCAFALEHMESRCHFTTTSWTTDSISTNLSHAYFAGVQMGDDGDPNGLATGVSGVGDTVKKTVFTTWDTNLDDGLDSGWRTVTFSLNTLMN